MLLLLSVKAFLSNWFFNFPEKLHYEIVDEVDAVVNWIEDVFDGLFDIISKIVIAFFDTTLLVFDFVPWWLFILLLLFAGWKLYSPLTGIILSTMLFLIGTFGLWDLMIYTLTIVFISVLVSLLIGIPTGIFMAKSRFLEITLKPILDGMQTMPSFVYLIPALMLFGIGKVPAIFATTVYAIPPLIRLTYLGIKNVNEEVLEAGVSFGSTPFQKLFKIELPQALGTIMTGVNQTTMMAMAMVVISSMIGADGIGYEVLIAIRRIQVGRGIQAGLAIVFLAIILDRVLQGLASKFDQSEGLDG